MNSKTHSEPYSTLSVHIDTLNGQQQLNNKGMYALACISNAIALTNNSRRSNISFLKQHKDTFIKLLSQPQLRPNCDYLCFVLNSITTE